MSINIHVRATREIVVVKTGVNEIQSVACSMIWQTPTKISNEIMNSDDKKHAYIEWVKSISTDEEIPIYAEDDIFSERDPIGFEKVNSGLMHVEEFLSWCDIMENKGYNIEFEAY